MTALQPIDEMDDRELVACAQQGDRQAFGELVCRHQASIVSMIYHLCGDLRQAEDAAQEAFIRIWQNLKHYKPQHAFRSWLYRIAANAALDGLRRERAVLDIDNLPPSVARSAAAATTPEKVVEDSQRAEQVRMAINRLSPALRLVLVLREYQQFSYQEIASVLDIPTGTVMSRLSSARSQLRTELISLLEEA